MAIKRKSSEIRNSRSAKKVKLAPSALRLDQLPTEILQKVVGNLNLWHRKNIRSTNRRMYEVCDGLLWHECQVLLAKYSKNPMANQKYAILKVVHQVTQIYVENGFGNLFLGVLLSVLRQRFHDSFDLTASQARQILQKFYNIVEQSVGHPFCPRSKVMYLTTVVNILTQAANSSLVALTLERNQLHMSFLMDAAYFGMLWNMDYCQMRCPEFHYPTDKNDLLVILAEILCMVEVQTMASRTYDTGHSLVFLGFGPDGRKVKPKINFELTIRGSGPVLEYFANLSAGVTQPIPSSSFAACLKIDCREASTRFGSSPLHHLVMGSSERDRSILRII